MRTKIIIAVIVIVLAALGVAVYRAKSESGPVLVETRDNVGTETASTKLTQTSADAPPEKAAGDNSGNYQPDTTSSGNGGALPPVPSDTSSLGILNSFITAQQSLSDETITVSFYGQGPGTFTVQKKVSGSWETLKEGVYFAGSGGLPAGDLAPGVESMTLRLLRIETGRYTSITKEFTVLRPDVISAGGIKTYS